MNAVPTRDELFEMAASPIGGEEARLHLRSTEGVAAGKRASKLWLPLGKRNPSASAEGKAARAAIRETQIDLEDAVEAAGGQRGGPK